MEIDIILCFLRRRCHKQKLYEIKSANSLK